MYTSYFGFHEQPFNIASDPRFLYATPVYQKAYTTLCSGIHDQKGFLVLTGEAGTGKTTLLYQLMAHLEKDPTVRCVFFPNTTLTFDEILTYTCKHLGLEENGTGRLKKIQALSTFLMNRSHEGGTTALLIDEAHMLDKSVLEDIRLLSNIEKENEKLLQIVFAGQPDLELRLNHPRLRQLKQRVALQCHLDCLTHEEVSSFIHHRLHTAGAQNQNLFSQAALQRIVLYSKGIPRLINIICDNALLVAYATAQKTITPEIIQEVADNLQLQEDTGEDFESPNNAGIPSAVGFTTASKYGPRIVGMETAPSEKVRQAWQHRLLERLPRHLAWTGGTAAFFASLALPALLWLAAPLARQALPGKAHDRSRAPAVVQLLPLAEEEVSREKTAVVVSGDPAWEHRPLQYQEGTASESQQVANFGVSGVSEGEAEDLVEDLVEDLAEEMQQVTTTDDSQDDSQQQGALPQVVAGQRILPATLPAILPEESNLEEEASPSPDTEGAGVQGPIELLARAEQQMARKRLTTPVGDNALETYQHVLNLFPNQQEAMNGIQKIQEQYRRWAERAKGREEWAKAQTYYEKALDMNPHDETIASALSQLKEQQLFATHTPQQDGQERLNERLEERLDESLDERHKARAQLAQLGISYKQEAFIKSAEEGDTQTVLAFLAAGMSPNVKDERGWGALMMAAFNGHPTTVRALLEKGADGQVSNETGGTALMMAAMHGYTDIVHALLDRSVPVNAKDAKGWTAAMYAAWNGHTSTVQSLFNRGANVNATDRDGWNALMYAAWNGHMATVRALLNNRAEVIAKNAQGESVLTLAASRGDPEIMELLKQAGAQE